jgi:hypothetical protein
MFTNFLSSFADGLFNDSGYLRDYKHASRIYVDNYYGMTPKSSWSYFVEFGLSPAMNNEKLFPSIDQGWYNKSRGTLGLLAKAVDLPRISIGNEVINQYNRKTVVQTKLTYNPITITLHDDMDNMATNLWKSYYQYYYADSRYTGQTKGSLNSRSLSSPIAFQPSMTGWGDNRAYAYGFNNGRASDESFFSFIKIFLLNRKKYTSVTLINPKITDWAPSGLSQDSGNRLLDTKMTIAYEAVYYDNVNQRVTKNEPGFNTLPYDTKPSPLRASGKGKGLGGLLSGSADILDTLGQESLSVGDIIKLGVQTKDLVDNAKSLTKQGIKQELEGMATNLLRNTAEGKGAIADSINETVKTPSGIGGLNRGTPLYYDDGTPIDTKNQTVASSPKNPLK